MFRIIFASLVSFTAFTAILLTGCAETTTSCQNPLGCDHEGHIIAFRGISG
jgi:hypothetical protein